MGVLVITMIAIAIAIAAIIIGAALFIIANDITIEVVLSSKHLVLIYAHVYVIHAFPLDLIIFGYVLLHLPRLESRMRRVE